MGALALGLGARELAFGASIVAVRVWPAAQYTRMTIESDQALVARHSLAEHPSRVVIDIDGLELSPELRDIVGKVRADDPFIAGVRVGQNQPRVACCSALSLSRSRASSGSGSRVGCRSNTSRCW